MMRKAGNERLEISPGICLGAALALLVLPLRWIAGAAAAAAFHELCHYLAVQLCGGDVRKIRVGAGGIEMETWPLSPGREMICALAGPVGSLSLLLLARWIPVTALCAAAQGMFNLLPVFPLDGGRALRRGAQMLSLPHGDKILKCLEWIVVVAVLGLGLYGWLVLKLGFFSVMIGLMLLERVLLRKGVAAKYGKSY